jgi:tripartite-type tricarboxylate transporter receptor subunit TctC
LLTDFEAISYIGSVAMVLVNAPGYAGKTAQELIAQAKVQPGT